MTNNQAIERIKDHMRVHKIGEPPHLKIAEALYMAIDALSAKQEPQPLTLEELRERIGKPVFEKGKDKGDCWWDVLDDIEELKAFTILHWRSGAASEWKKGKREYYAAEPKE